MTSSSQIVRETTDVITNLVSGIVKAKTKRPAAVPPVMLSKQDRMIAMLRRPEAATLAELVEATGWQAHSVRGAVSGIKKKFGSALVFETVDGRGRVYRLKERS